MLMPTEALAEQPPRTTAFHRTTDFPAGDNAEFWCCADRQFVPVGDETTLCEPLSLLPDAHEITILTEAHGATQGCRRFGDSAGMNARGLNRGQAFASDAAAVAQRGFAALARIAVKKSVLPFAADFRRLILAFHKWFSVLPGERPERARIAMKRLVSRRGSAFKSTSRTQSDAACEMQLPACYFTSWAAGAGVGAGVGAEF